MFGSEAGRVIVPARNELSLNEMTVRRLQFDLLSMLGLTVVIATVLTAFQRPYFVFVILCTLALLCLSPLRGQSFVATAIHNAMIGVVSGLVIAILNLALAISSDDETVSRAALGLFHGPVLGAVFGSACAWWRKRCPTARGR